MALNGDGYFVVAERTGSAGNSPVFSGQDLYTRRGDFALDKDGYLRNGAGFYLKGVSVDPATGSPLGSAAGIIQIRNDRLPARQSSTIEYRANLPLYPRTQASDPAVANSELLSPTLVTGPPATAYITAADAPAFMNQTLEGPSITLYNAAGAPVNVQSRWAKTAKSDTAAAPPVRDTWQLFHQENSSATGAQPMWRSLGTPFEFGASGALVSPATGMASASFTVNGVTVGPVNFDTGAGGLTQFADVNGLVAASRLAQDGYTAGDLQGVNITSDGRISGSFSNGQLMPLANIPVVQFNADEAMKRRDGGVFEQTIESGLPIVSTNGSQIVGGSVENSNTDIAEEFTKMIVTQQAYSANTRVISTAQQMLQDTINIVR